MKFKVGDQVLVTSGKDKGKTGKIIKVLPEQNAVVVEGMNLYKRSIKRMFDRPGQQITQERPLNVGKIAIVNDSGNPDRVGFKIDADGVKTRVFKKAGSTIVDSKENKSSKNSKK